MTTIFNERTKVINKGSEPIPVTTGTSVPLVALAPSAVSVGVTSGQIVAANSDRKGLILVNTSTAHISIGIGVEAVLYSGITLNPLGGSFSMDQQSLAVVAIHAISTGADSNLSIQEFE